MAYTYTRKTQEEWHLQVDYGYGHGWETECIEFSRKEGQERLKEYQANCQYAVRLVKKRVKIEPQQPIYNKGE